MGKEIQEIHHFLRNGLNLFLIVLHEVPATEAEAAVHLGRSNSPPIQITDFCETAQQGTVCTCTPLPNSSEMKGATGLEDVNVAALPFSVPLQARRQIKAAIVLGDLTIASAKLKRTLGSSMSPSARTAMMREDLKDTLKGPSVRVSPRILSCFFGRKSAASKCKSGRSRATV